jgi:hypothetical protein
MIVWHIVVFLTGFGLGVLSYLITRPVRKLTEEELMCAIDLIWNKCEGKYDRGRRMIDELYMWLTDKKQGAVSKELFEIIEMSRTV